MHCVATKAIAHYNLQLGLRKQIPNIPRERNRFPYVRQLAYPTDNTLQSETETAMRHRTETAQIQVPLECFHRQAVVMDGVYQLFDIRFTLAAAYYLAITFRCKYIHTANKAGGILSFEHVKCLDR